MVLNWIIYAIALIGAVFTFFATNNATTLALVAAIALSPLAGIVASLFASRHTKLSLDVQPSCTVGQDLSLEITIQRPLPLRGRMELVLEGHNLLSGTIRRIPISLAPSVAHHEVYLFPLNTQLCGHVVLSIASIHVTDVMGFAKFAVKCPAVTKSYTVYPQINDLSVRTERVSFTNYSGTTYDRHHKGQDRTEVFEMRDFRKGDSLKSVHWKLSARFDELLVREPSRPAEHNIVLLFDAHAFRLEDQQQVNVLNAALSVLASVSLALVRQGIEHTVAESDGYALRSLFVDNRIQFNEMVDNLMDIPLATSETADATPFRIDGSTPHDTKVVLITNLNDNALPAKLRRMVDLTVIRVASTDAMTIDESGGYPLINLPADAVAETKVLEI